MSEIPLSNKRTALIMAGGAGLRMGAALPKQFLLLGGRPVLMKTLTTFYDWDSTMHIILVLPDAHRAYWTDLCRHYTFQVPHECVSGGESRFESVKNGLAVAGTEGVIAIHDGVRPLVSPAVIERCFQAAASHGAVVPVVNLVDSVRQVTESGNRAVDRAGYRLVQTPQTFQAAIIQRAYSEVPLAAYTDDASVAEAIGCPIHLVEGDRCNLKITEAVDLLVAEWHVKNP